MNLINHLKVIGEDNKRNERNQLLNDFNNEKISFIEFVEKSKGLV